MPKLKQTIWLILKLVLPVAATIAVLLFVFSTKPVSSTEVALSNVQTAGAPLGTNRVITDQATLQSFIASLDPSYSQHNRIPSIDFGNMRVTASVGDSNTYKMYVSSIVATRWHTIKINIVKKECSAGQTPGVPFVITAIPNSSAKLKYHYLVSQQDCGTGLEVN